MRLAAMCIASCTNCHITHERKEQWALRSATTAVAAAPSFEADIAASPVKAKQIKRCAAVRAFTAVSILPRAGIGVRWECWRRRRPPWQLWSGGR